MAIATDSLVEVTLNMQYLGQRVANVFQYRVAAYAGGIAPVQMAEGWWNDVKATYRAATVNSGGAQFLSVKLAELDNPTGDYAEFPIPVGERQGTRDGSTLGDFMPSYTAVGVRFTVGTRTTRPGQKRFPFVVEADNSQNQVGSALLALVNSWAENLSNQIIMGIPAVGVTFVPIVVSRNPDTGALVAYQDVIGYVTNPYLTTQNSRKYGRGA